jgi:hypothetical protein
MAITYRWFENVSYAANFTQLQRLFPSLTNIESYLRDHNWAKLARSASNQANHAPLER